MPKINGEKRGLTPKEYKRKKRIFDIVRYVVIFSLFSAIVLVSVLLPYRTLLPAYDFPSVSEGEAQLLFLDVGQGDCSLVKYPNGDVYLIDGGSGTFDNRTHLIRVLKTLSPKNLTVIVTHADEDHIGGLGEICSLFPVANFYYPLYVEHTSEFESLKSSAINSGAKTYPLVAYDVFGECEDGFFTCLSPRLSEEISLVEENDLSLVLYFKWKECSILFSGDISYKRENLLLDNEATLKKEYGEMEYDVSLNDISVLKVAHHGSSASSSLEWIKLLAPSYSIISCGRGNAYSHPSLGTLNRLSASLVMRTDELHDILLTVSKGISVKTNVFGR